MEYKTITTREELSKFLRKEIHNYFEGWKEPIYFKADWAEIVESLERKGYGTHGKAKFHPIGCVTMIFEHKKGYEIPLTYNLRHQTYCISN